MKPNTCIVDFDDTLLKTDSLRYILKRERLYLNPSILWWGAWLFVLQFILPRPKQLWARNRLKFKLINILEEKREYYLQKYTPYFISYINFDLVNKLKSEYSQLLVVTASWEPLVKKILNDAGLFFVVYGTVRKENFKDFYTNWNINKLKVINSLNLSNFDLYTDSCDDAPLIRLANKVVYIKKERTKTKILALILLVALLLRLVGISYGLPLWLVGDEPALIFGSLKMLELKTILPVLHASSFGSTFYYGPYLPIIYLLPFTFAVGIKYLFFAGSFILFKQFLLADPSIFFIVARLISAFLGTATVWLVYKISLNIFAKTKTALVSAAFMAISFLAVSLSHWARHWGPVTFIFSLIIFFLSQPNWSVKKRYLLSALALGLGMGVSIQVGLAALIIIGWFFIIDKLKISLIIKRAWLWQALIIFFSLTLVAFLIWPPAFSFIYSLTGNGSRVGSRNWAGVLPSFWYHLVNLFKTEPVLLFSSLFGMMVVWFRNRRFFLVANGFIIIYILFFYLTLGNVDRYILMAYPLLIIFCGLGWTWLLEKFNFQISFILLLAALIFMFATAARLDYLLVKNDTRVQAQNWFAINVPAGSRVMVLSTMRLRAATGQINELATVDKESLRNVDKAEATLPNNILAPVYYAFNAYTVNSSTWFANINEYIKINRYQYIIFDKEFLASKKINQLNYRPTQIIKEFNGPGTADLSPGHQRVPDGFGDGLKEIFYSSSLGPNLIIVKLF